MSNKIYLFGLHRSGTNYLAKLLHINFSKLEMLNTNSNFSECWKHSLRVPQKIENVPLFVIYKNHLTWLESVIFRKPSDGKHIITSTEIEENILDQNRIVKTKNDFILSEQKISLNLITNCYKQFYENWVFFLEENILKKLILIKYEDLLIEEQRNNILNKISDILNWQKCRKNKSWINPEKGDVFLSNNYNDELEKYYIEGCPKQLTSEQIEVANFIIDNKFKEKLNNVRLH
jgi:hypothetical protein